MRNVLYGLMHWNTWSPGVGPALRGYRTLEGGALMEDWVIGGFP